MNIHNIDWLSLTFNNSYSYTRCLYVVEIAEFTAPLQSFIETMLVLVKSFKEVPHSREVYPTSLSTHINQKNIQVGV